MAHPARSLGDLRWVGLPVMVAGYAVACHVVLTRAPGSLLAVLVVLGPFASMAVAGLWRSGRRLPAAAGALAFLLLAMDVQWGRGFDPRLLFLAEHAVAHIALGLWFASTLRRGHQPLISALALRLHGALDAGLARYTRRVTAVWVLYFFGMAAVSVGLFRFADFADWSFFAYLLTPVAAVSLFGVEYLLRYRLHPEFERVSLADGIRAYRSLRVATARTEPR